MADRCTALDPVGIIGRNVRCDLREGHKGKHKATRREGDWASTAEWEQEVIDDELRALREVAKAAEAYFEHSKTTDHKYWPQQMNMHNALAALRNFRAAKKATPMKSEDPK